MEEDNYEDHFSESDWSDPQFQEELKELYEEELQRSMEWAYAAIHEMSFERWRSITPFPDDRKRRIVENMIHWFEDREEYEKCAFLYEGLNSW